jgi:ssDNA-binding Zn-finger/Zn-ribbon topoisomerase 1
MAIVPKACPTCGGPLLQCSESGGPPGHTFPCGALYCPKCHWINIESGKCPLDNPDCPALA